ncbi:MAG: DUF2017 family protein [Verrucomicrobiales bacterium]|nr:DUF2017 family protein [Verrucomicrobiales bacterium]
MEEEGERGLRLRRRGGGGFVIEVMRERELKALMEIWEEADAGSVEGADGRLFPDPVRGGEDEDEFRAEWREYVHEELRERFAGDLQVIRDDLGRLLEIEGKRVVLVRMENVGSWMSGLNQARLVMQQRYGFPEEMSPEAVVEMIQGGKIEAYVRSGLYAGILEWMIANVAG